jgi:hypothetical protein
MLHRSLLPPLLPELPQLSHHTIDKTSQVFGSKKNGDMAMVVLRKGLVQGKQTNLQIVQTIVGTVLDKGFGGGDCLFSGANIEGGGIAAAAAAAVTKLPGGEQEVLEWAEFLGWSWRAAFRIGDALLLLKVMVVMMHLLLRVFVLVAEFPAGARDSTRGSLA